MSIPIDYGKKIYFSKVALMLFCILFVTIMISKVFATSNTAKEEGLISYWNFDELEEGDTEFLDLSGNGRHGILHNNTHPIEGKFGKALKFDGLADYAEIPYDAGLSCLYAISVEAWIYPTPPHQENRNGGIINNINGRSNARLLITATGMLLAELYGDSNYYRVSGPIAPNETWSHVVYVHDGLDGIIYVNGEPGTPIPCPNLLRVGTNSLTIGWGHTGNNYHYSGLIDEVKIYNRALSTQEIEAKYKQFDRE
jgi:hypothetical protein